MQPQHKISVLLPVYNGAKTISTAIGSVLSQSRPADEILVVNDGSTDNTLEVLRAYGNRIQILSHENRGVAASRNVLCMRASGDLFAFLDADDIWHPEYLANVEREFGHSPRADVLYVGHFDFRDSICPPWPNVGAVKSEMYDSLEFFNRYNRTTGHFASMSYCSFRRSVVETVGSTPFQVDGVEDSYLAYWFSLCGLRVMYFPIPLVAYRISEQSLSADHVKMYARWLQVFELMRKRFDVQSDGRLLRSFRLAFASKRRAYAKLLMGSGRVLEARQQLRQSFRDSQSLMSLGKSTFILSRTYLSASWPTGRR